jgi:hypothetical protein
VGPQGASRQPASLEPARRLRSPRCRVMPAASTSTCRSRPSCARRRQPGQGLSGDQDEGRAQEPVPRTSSASAPCASTWAQASRSWSTPT